MADDTWTVSVTVPANLPEEMLASLFTAVADAAHEWLPTERDGWDVSVTGARDARPDAGGLRDRIAEVIRETVPLHQGGYRTADAVMAVLQPEIDDARAALDAAWQNAQDWHENSELVTKRADRAEAAVKRARDFCELVIATSCRVQAIEQAQDTLAVLDQKESH